MSESAAPTAQEAPMGAVSDLVTIAEGFALPAPVAAVEPLGRGNVNDTYLVSLRGEDQPRFVLQRLNTRVFRRPKLVMGNISAVVRHVERRLAEEPPQPGRLPWRVPQVVPARGGSTPWLVRGEAFWRTLSFIEDSRSHETITDLEHAREIGYGLGRFHSLISDLPASELADTLEGFHITPGYLAEYRRVLAESTVSPSAETEHCLAFVQQRQDLASVLEQARTAGRLQLRPIHGDPKINNLLMASGSVIGDGEGRGSQTGCGQAIALVDLDTVKPGLVHYDIGDCLRSACNRLGEETRDWPEVQFDLELAEALLEGYLGQARAFLTPDDFAHIPEAIRLIPFELGLRFLTDHLAGNVYFKVSHPGHNLERALVQFQLTRSIEAQLPAIRAIVERLRATEVAP
ncbi:phosphotransferase enzyme family protein [Vulcanococcus limneticus]|uniref:phosphotransferase enzyme family protein n=1 Tax=Vulcanococcus limneticus TaxID=2170428 RepID=UPI0028F40E7A|nr:aminoglycoside phosphotransferase family protein [Vulcanococcus limneticus]